MQVLLKLSRSIAAIMYIIHIALRLIAEKMVQPSLTVSLFYAALKRRSLYNKYHLFSFVRNSSFYKTYLNYICTILFFEGKVNLKNYFPEAFGDMIFSAEGILFSMCLYLPFCIRSCLQLFRLFIDTYSLCLSDLAYPRNPIFLSSR